MHWQSALCGDAGCAADGAWYDTLDGSVINPPQL